MKKASVLLALLITAFVAKELLWAALVPSTDAPDELAHYSYVQTLFHDRTLPVLGETYFYFDRSEGGRETPPDLNWIAQHPPLYYALLLPVYAIFPYNDMLFPILALRLFSIFLGACTLFFAYKTVKNMLPENEHMALGVAAAIGFLPMFSYISALINNDNLVNLLAVILLSLLTSRPGGHGKKTSRWKLQVGLTLAALALTKATALPLFGVVLAAQFLDYVHSPKVGKPQIIRQTFYIFAVPAVLAGWWYLRNFGLYKTFLPELKDVVALKPEILTKYPSLVAAFPEIAGTANPGLSFAGFLFDKAFLLEYFKNIWGVFGRFFVQLTDIQYLAIFGFCFMSLVGYFRKLYYGVKKNWFSNLTSSPQFILFLTALAMAGAITYKLFEIARERGFLGAMQGRYFFAAILPFFYFWLRGWDHLLPQRTKNYVFALLVCAFIINDITTLFAVIIPQYY